MLAVHNRINFVRKADLSSGVRSCSTDSPALSAIDIGMDAHSPIITSAAIATIQRLLISLSHTE